jgi:DNA-directed RNA polymerase subunit beta'
VLTDAAVRGAKEELIGLENIIIGHLIPAGTGVYRNHDIEFEVDLTPSKEEADVFTERARDLFPGIEEETEHTPAD